MLRRTTLRMALGAVLLGLVLTPAWAGKGGNKGKPGGGGGGGSLPREDIVFTARPVGQGGVNFYGIYTATTDGSHLAQVSSDENYGWSHLTVDPRGEIVGAWEYADGQVAIELDTGAETVLNTPLARGWTRRTDAGELLPYDQQRILVRLTARKGPERPDLPGEPYIVNDIGFAATDGSGDTWPLTQLSNSWDESTRIFVYRSANVIGYVPVQTDASVTSWVIYSHREAVLQYEPAPSTDFTIVDDDTYTRIMTLDVSDWASNGVVDTDDVLSDTITTHPLSENPYGAPRPAAVSPDGRWALVNRLGKTFLVPADPSSGVPEFPKPDETLDLIPVSPPQGWDADVQVRAVNHDGTLVALNLFRDERHGRYGIKRTRHLFVARRDGSDLTQIDVSTDGVEFEYGFGDDSFLSVAFGPPAAGQ